MKSQRQVIYLINFSKIENIKYAKDNIIFVWSQYDGGNTDKEQLAEVPSKT